MPRHEPELGTFVKVKNAASCRGPRLDRFSNDPSAQSSEYRGKKSSRPKPTLRLRRYHRDTQCSHAV